MIYLDNNSTTPVDPDVLEVMTHYLRTDFGNAGSISHSFGSRAKKAVEHARQQIASNLECAVTDIVFTSGATESNNIAILGLEDWLRSINAHTLTSKVEHKAVLEPFEQLASNHIEVNFLEPFEGHCRFEANHVMNNIRPETAFVSLMWANNETGCISDIPSIAKEIKANNPNCLIHTDITQALGKLEYLDLTNVDLASASAHKIYGPKGIGFLYANRHARKHLKHIYVGGGQERGLRPGTQPVFLISGLGRAVELACSEYSSRRKALDEISSIVTDIQKILGAQSNSSNYSLPNTSNIWMPGRDAEAAMIRLKEEFALSSGSACTSSSFAPSHVLQAAFPNDPHRWTESLRISWSHLTPAFSAQTFASLLN